MNKLSSNKSIVKKCVIALIITSVGGCYIYHVQNNSAKSVVAQEVPASTMALSRQTISDSLSLSGNIYSDAVTNVYSTLSYIVSDTYVDVGDVVKVGDVLASLDTTDIESKITQLNNSIASDSTSIQSSILTNELSVESSDISLQKEINSYNEILKEIQKLEAEILEAVDTSSIKNGESSILTKERSVQDVYERIVTAERSVESAKRSVESAKTSVITAERSVVTAEMNVEAAERKVVDNERSIEDYNRKIEIAENSLKTAQNDYDSYKILFDSGIIAKVEFDKYESSLDDAKTAVTTAELNLQNGLSTLESSKTDIVSAELNVENAILNVATANVSVENAEINVENAEIELENLYRTLDEANYDLDLAKIDYDEILVDYDKATEDLIENRQDELDSLYTSLNSAKLSIDTAQINLDKSKDTLYQYYNGTSSLDTSIQNSILDLTTESENMDKTKIVSAVNGTITEKTASVGATASGVLFVIEDTKDIYVSVSVKENNLASVIIGQPATITTEATGNAIFSGEVSYVSPKSTSGGDGTTVEYEVHVKINDASDLVKLGMNAFVNIVTDLSENVFIAPYDAIISTGRASTVYVLENGSATPISVTTGLQANNYVEIISDELKEGMEIITNPSDLSDLNNITTSESVGGGASTGGAGGEMAGGAGGEMTGAGEREMTPEMQEKMQERTQSGAGTGAGGGMTRQ